MIGIYFLYVLLGWSVWVGVSIVVLAPVPGYSELAKLVGQVQKELLKHTDKRVFSASEAVSVLHMVLLSGIVKLRVHVLMTTHRFHRSKPFGWEGKMRERILEKRHEELKHIWKPRLLELASPSSSTFLILVHFDHGFDLRDLRVFDPPLVLYAVIARLQALVMRQPLTASKVFLSMTIFDFIRDRINRLTWQMDQLITSKVSLDRVNDFLHKTELLDQLRSRSAETPALLVGDANQNEQIGFRNTTFTWSKTRTIEPARAPRARKINLIAGPTGSGKTSMLIALLGEMHFIPSSPDSWFGLPRMGGVAYATQES
ncbi:Multidrug resistance-associated ABC transporter protein [Mycena chlorophos]|uniref:Multidrug resistance-associated ABC transporter protein n=1 Tax=Mycena chlorophos TaxID=658473 RepID=A0A8H6TDL3_MYCCL|nr:Multidrug resistance-associated ABC transporter protein [Mycena chlorophos]